MRLSKLRIKRELAKVHGWRLAGKEISRRFMFDDFRGSMRFVNAIARRAQRMNHHPDILIKYDKVRLALTTHDEGGLTMKDFKLARKANELVD